MSTERPAFAPAAEDAAARPGSAARPVRPTSASDVLRVVADAGGAAFATDGDARIVAWNHSAEQLLGHKASAVRGRTLSEVLQSRDLFGNRISCECGTQEMIRRGEHVRRHVIVVTTASGELMRVVVSVQPPAVASSSPLLVYHLRSDSRRRQGDRRAFDPTRFPDGIAALTPAEMKILRLLAAGKRAQDAATSLGVSLTTVRNHIQHVFRKLGVHNQVEAITLALRNGLV